MILPLTYVLNVNTSPHEMLDLNNTGGKKCNNANQAPPPSLRSPPLETERGPLQRNLALSESSMFPPLPSQEAVLEELQEVTLQYTNCKDPTESAARRHRVLQGEMNGLMAKRLLPS